jgi:hypothetical protein
MKHIPEAVSLFLCDQVIVEEGTHNVTPVNCFREKLARDPAQPISFTVFALLTDGVGAMRLTVEIHRLQDMDLVYQVSRTVQFAQPLNEYRVGLRFYKLSLPTFGAYQVTLLADREFLAHRKFSFVANKSVP